MRTAQQIFDTVVNHLRKQNAKAYDKDTRLCRYRMDDGKKCAIGVLIPDQVYHHMMETLLLVQILWKNNVCWFLPTDLEMEMRTHQFLLSGLQSIHDLDDVKNWEMSFQKLANQHHLQYTPPSITNNI